MMTEPTPSDKNFDEYMTGKSKLSALYQNSETSGPNEFLDQTILNAARDEVNAKNSKTEKIHRWHIPVSIAAALITAIIIIQVVPQKELNVADLDHKTASDESKVTAGKAAPERLLDKISAHIESNEIEKAKEEYRIFLKLFPDYKIDYKKHPEVKKLDQ